MTTTTKMTKVQALTAILAYVQDDENLTAFCKHEIDLLNKKSAKSAEKSAEKSAVYATIANQFKAVMSKPMTTTEIIKATGLDITNQRASYILNNSEGIVKTREKGVTYFSLAD